MRRILENGANSSFVYRLLDPEVAIRDLSGSGRGYVWPWRHSASGRALAGGFICPDRRNSAGLDLNDPFVTGVLLAEMETMLRTPLPNSPHRGEGTDLSCGALFSYARGGVRYACSRQPVETRAASWERLADALEDQSRPLMGLLVAEGFKSIPDAWAKCARRLISAVTTRHGRGSISRRCPCPGRPARKTPCVWSGAAFLCV